MAAEFATRADLHELERRVEARLHLLEVIDERFDLVDRRFDHVDQRFNAIDRQFDRVDHHFELVDRRFDLVDRQLRRLRNWGTIAFLVVVLLETFIAWRIGL
jgi:hypothetical protein